MSDEKNNINKDVANSLNSSSDFANKSINNILDSANLINIWYSEQINKLSENEIPKTRLETNIDNTIEEQEQEKSAYNKIETKIEKYNEIQTNNKNKTDIHSNYKIKTQAEKNELNGQDIETNEDKNKKEENETKILSNTKSNKVTKRISRLIKGVKNINNITNKAIKTGKSINTALTESGLKSFENSSSKIMTKPIKKATNKITSKATNKITKVGTNTIKKVAKGTSNIVIKTTKIMMKFVADSVKLLLSMLPSIAPVLIIVIIIAALGNFLNLDSVDEGDDINFDTVSEMIIEIDDENLQAIYNEFLKNMGKPYLMDHSNLSYDTCMDSYDCSSWVIHCLAHTGIKTISDTTASGIYNEYCNTIDIDDRQAGDLIFLKDTYDTESEDGISHVGIYMGELTINGETTEWIIDTGGNPEGVKISKYNDGWWDGENFYGFGRLK